MATYAFLFTECIDFRRKPAWQRGDAHRQAVKRVCKIVEGLAAKGASVGVLLPGGGEALDETAAAEVATDLLYLGCQLIAMSDSRGADVAKFKGLNIAVVAGAAWPRTWPEPDDVFSWPDEASRLREAVTAATAMLIDKLGGVSLAAVQKALRSQAEAPTWNQAADLPENLLAAWVDAAATARGLIGSPE